MIIREVTFHLLIFSANSFNQHMNISNVKHPTGWIVATLWKALHISNCQLGSLPGGRFKSSVYK